VGKLRALVADDSRVFRICIGELLRDHGFEVDEAAGGREALEVALVYRPELLILDALMPGLTGFDVLGKLREEVPEYHPIVFFVTAVFKSHRWESEARQTHGVHEYLEKPIEDATMLAALARHFTLDKP
jgi:CheY-like chemotaxis protein